jgi:hypothetical protein
MRPARMIKPWLAEQLETAVRDYGDDLHRQSQPFATCLTVRSQAEQFTRVSTTVTAGQSLIISATTR